MAALVDVSGISRGSRAQSPQRGSMRHDGVDEVVMLMAMIASKKMLSL
ncbi:hypothetical protein LE191_10010 [Janthinobacterium sp. HSC-3S05]|nr:hypothetical protein [Janthinobacterium lividum]MCA1860435.1 hypothetical protein [Janthinobacterium lividum]